MNSAAPHGIKSRNRWMVPAVIVVVPLILMAIAAAVLRGCMTEHSRHIGHGDITFDISPDGHSLVFAGQGKGGRDLYLLDLKTERVTPLTSSRDYEICPSFSPDGRSIAFTRGTPGVRADQLCVMDLGSKQIEQLTDADENVSSPVFLWDGQRIACTFETEYRWGGLASSWYEGGELRTVEIATRRQTLLVTPYVPVFKPRVSADGRWLAWVGANGAEIAPLQAPQQASLVSPQGESLALNNDGTRIAVSSGNYSPNHKIYLVDRATKNRRVISGTTEGCFDPVFSPDGQFVYFLAEDWLGGATGIPTRRLMKASVDGGQPQQIGPTDLLSDPLSNNDRR